MDDATAQELTRLRSRAYGPDADILGDPVAGARLAELEELLRRERLAASPTASAPRRPGGGTTTAADASAIRPVGGGSEPIADGNAIAPRAAEGTDSAPSAPADEATDEASATARLWALVRMLTSRLPPLATTAWAVSIAAAVALTASVIWSLASLPVVSPVTGAQQVATLEADESVRLPTGFFGNASEGAPAYEYFGLVLGRSSAPTFDGSGDCLIALDEDDLSPDGMSVNGAVYYGCRAGAFPATIEMTVNDDAPEELQAEFPEGGALQFVLEGDRIGVFWDGGAARAQG